MVDKTEAVGFTGTAIETVLTVSQTNEILQIVQIILSILTFLVTIGYTIYKWYKKAISEDSKGGTAITKEEIYGTKKHRRGVEKMSIELKGKVYRNTQEQVEENAKNIEALQETVGEHTTDIEALQETVGEHTTDIEALKDKHLYKYYVTFELSNADQTLVTIFFNSSTLLPDDLTSPSDFLNYITEGDFGHEGRLGYTAKQIVYVCDVTSAFITITYNNGSLTTSAYRLITYGLLKTYF